MKKILLLSFFLLSVFNVFAQTFEGRIVYFLSYQTKNEKMADMQWASLLGTSQNYLIKGGNYKSLLNGSLAQWQLYINKDNKLYNKMSNAETVYWNDAGIQADEIYKAEVNKNVTEILGYKCDELILTCKSGTQKYYYSSKLGVNPKLFINHKFGNWYDYVLKSNALPLKSIIETAQVTITSTATRVEPMKLDNDTFELPAGTVTAKSPY